MTNSGTTSQSRKRPSDTRLLSSSSSSAGVAAGETAAMSDATNTAGSSTTLPTHSRLPKLTVRIKRIQGVAQWSWNANDEVCGICHNPFEGNAPGVRYPGEDSPVVWGKCGHAFHLQCISRWLQQSSSKNLCPICRQEWEFGQNNA